MSQSLADSPFLTSFGEGAGKDHQKAVFEYFLEPLLNCNQLKLSAARYISLMSYSSPDDGDDDDEELNVIKCT